MRAVSLLRVAAEAELLRLRHMLMRQDAGGLRVIAAVFAVCVLVLVNVGGWQVLRGSSSRSTQHSFSWASTLDAKVVVPHSG